MLDFPGVFTPIEAVRGFVFGALFVVLMVLLHIHFNLRCEVLRIRGKRDTARICRLIYTIVEAGIISMIVLNWSLFQALVRGHVVILP
ncbi:hypothetical protein G4V39_09990 [Thermosulfuriphilus ammonigenes]|uniref:Uncharacterized protein n=1 Tax=Thermosulfuriphilus ammonigenes TaxID=1936021 RepID=A0A6G7PY44_9BACT|nr:hypothetical protein [Thermosulfuriphilus ammonigenes]MBA2849517.1 hypothetical protein [Thermosulfuriphilus ammonigenes]QIJ72582.1 hypothetical protein G4V39_09990 [Thermosulfuriphilus ammonigenes]